MRLSACTTMERKSEMNARILEVFQLTKGGVPRSAAALAAGVLATGLFGFAQHSVQQALVRPDLLPLRVRSLFKSYGGTHLTTAGMERLQIVGTLAAQRRQSGTHFRRGNND